MHFLFVFLIFRIVDGQKQGSISPSEYQGRQNGHLFS